jgi:hypothetical protein
MPSRRFGGRAADGGLSQSEERLAYLAEEIEVIHLVLSKPLT